MLIDYLHRAMHQATYELLEEHEGFYGEIPGFAGLWATAPTLEACRDELQSALEDWILFSVAHHDPLPVIDGLTLAIKPIEV